MLLRTVMITTFVVPRVVGQVSCPEACMTLLCKASFPSIDGGLPCRAQTVFPLGHSPNCICICSSSECVEIAHLNSYPFRRYQTISRTSPSSPVISRAARSPVLSQRRRPSKRRKQVRRSNRLRVPLHPSWELCSINPSCHSTHLLFLSSFPFITSCSTCYISRYHSTITTTDPVRLHARADFSPKN